jgi:hypothetical protein
MCLKPRSAKTPNIPVKARANDSTPNPSAPRYRAVYIIKKNPMA